MLHNIWWQAVGVGIVGAVRRGRRLGGGLVDNLSGCGTSGCSETRYARLGSERLVRGIGGAQRWRQQWRSVPADDDVMVTAQLHEELQDGLRQRHRGGHRYGASATATDRRSDRILGDKCWWHARREIWGEGSSLTGGGHVERAITDRWGREGTGARLAVRGGRERGAGRFHAWVGPVR
jgi:hypothetical protein